MTSAPRLVARFAYLQLDPDVRTKVDDLLSGGPEAFADGSIWADRIKTQDQIHVPGTTPIIPLEADAYDRERDCPKSNCIVEKLQQFIEVLKAGAATKTEPVEAWRFVIHFVADIHQPLHCANNDDRGGDDVSLMWRRERPARDLRPLPI